MSYASLSKVFPGRVENGKLLIGNKPELDAYLVRIEGREVEVTVRLPFEGRTAAENRYYWGVCVKLISEEMGVTPDEAHEYLKSLFLKVGVEGKGGKRWEIIRSTRNLSIPEFEEYVEKVRTWAATELNVVVPLPGEIEINL